MYVHSVPIATEEIGLDLGYLDSGCSDAYKLKTPDKMSEQRMNRNPKHGECTC